MRWILGTFGFARRALSLPLLFLGASMITTPALAQPLPPRQPAAGELLRAIERLAVVGSVLYVAAHPDDENTRLIAYLSGARGLEVTYLSMTRGGGGQNLIGAEQDALLGVVRTGELLAARRVDGAGQRFTRARDFGYSKSPEETLAMWGADAALEDVVWAVRALRPDVVITRFETTGRNHGHHTASAILAAEAVVAAADPSRFPEQLAPRGPLETWTVDRLLQNKSHWRFGPDTDKSGWMTLDVGAYDPRLGQGYGEVAARSRSMHKSQGFGAAPTVGPQLEYFERLAGAALRPSDDPLTGLDLTWARFAGTEALRAALARAVAAFDPRRPAAALPALAEAHRALDAVPDARWRAVKRAELEAVMLAAAGVWLEATAEQAAVTPGASMPVRLRALLRVEAPVALRGLSVRGGGREKGVGAMDVHSVVEREVVAKVPEDAALTVPHWLRAAPEQGRYTIEDPAWRTEADTPAGLTRRFELTVAGVELTVERPVEFAWTDAVEGERRHPVEVLPPVTATLDRDALVIPTGRAVRLQVALRSGAPSQAVSGRLRWETPAGVTVTPATQEFSLPAGQPEQTVEVEVRVSAGAGGALRAVAEVDGRAWSWQRAVIDYPHLPRRTVLRPAEARVTPVALEPSAIKAAGRVAHLPGSGDAVADALRAVGYAIDDLTVDALAAGELRRYDTLLVGVRAYNKHPRLLGLHPQLMRWVEAGGRLVVQYNTNNRFNPLDGPIGPYPFSISADRVTDERAPLTPVAPAHAVLRGPHRLTEADAAGWVQERGLYFAGTWDARYAAVYSAADAGEPPLRGALLVARHGKGVFVYTGLSFFRQLPAGVPGAFRLLANLLAAK